MRDRQLAAMIRRVFPDDQARALCVAGLESTGVPGHYDPAAQNGSNTGLFQIDERTWDWRARTGYYRRLVIRIVGRLDWRRMHEALYNARAARRLYLYERRQFRNGWLPWTTRELCGA